MLELNFEHIGPGALCGLVIRKRIVAEGPGVPLAPEAIHECIHEFDLRIAIKFRSQKANQFLECLLKKRIIVPRLISRMRVLQKSFRLGAAFLIAQQPDPL